jgi:hypothetical protein
MNGHVQRVYLDTIKDQDNILGDKIKLNLLVVYLDTIKDQDNILGDKIKLNLLVVYLDTIKDQRGGLQALI